MANTTVDVTRLKETGHDIVTLSMEYSEIINTFFDRVNGYSRSDTWVGSSAENYISLANTEKSTYDSVGQIISSYGKVLIDNAESYEEFIRKTKIDE